MAYDVGCDILIFGSDAPLVPLVSVEDDVYNANYYDLSGVEDQGVLIRVLGLQGYFADAVDSLEINNIKIKIPYVYHFLTVDGHPLDVLNDEQMELFYQIGILNNKQYKYIAVEGTRITTPYPILSKIPAGKAMLISDLNAFQPTFNYSSANRKFQIQVRSYYPIRNS